MCGRFSLHASPDAVRARFGLDEQPRIGTRYNIAPSARVACVGSKQGRRLLRTVVWGLLPTWARRDETGLRRSQARSETAGSKPSFASAWRLRRCLLPASGFYEWAPGPGPKEPWYVHGDEDQVLAIAALWERWSPPGSDRAEVGCAVLTREAEGRLADIHPRMPVLLRPEAFEAWLDPGLQDPGAVAELVQEHSLGGDELSAWRVSRDLNDARNEGAELCAPLAGDGDPTA